ncbi:MAG: hypothetical protein ACOC3V_02395 [bacterium]
MAKVKELPFKISSEKTENLINTLKDLSSIDKKVVFKIDPQNILMYSKVGEGNSINAFKSFIYKTTDLLEIGQFDETINYVTNDSKEMYRKLQILNSFEKENVGKFHYDSLGDTYYAERIALKASTKLKLNFTCDDPTYSNSKISVDAVKSLMNTDNANFSFDLKSDDFTNIKRLSSSDSENDIFYLNTIEKEGKYYVSIGESMWDLTLSEIDYNDNITISFPKKYFKSITFDEDIVKVYVFDSMIMITNPSSDMLISTELSV